MEILYLFCSFLTTFCTSLALSLLLPFRLFLTRRRSTTATTHNQSVSLYEGTVWHERRHPVRHAFRYPVRYALFDLDHAPNVPPDHLSADEARHAAETSGPVFLLTIPPSVGYEQNPLNLYYCYNLDGSGKHLQKCIAEVTNTPWGERVSFLFNPNSDFLAKALHVSPFMDMLGNWSIRANDPAENLSVAITVHHPDLGEYFVAVLKAKRISSFLVSDHAVFFWLMPHKVAIWIYWNALKLWWKNVPFIQHPRYSNPSYREDALTRDKRLRCCSKGGNDNGEHVQFERNTPEHAAEKDQTGRCFVWRDAKWPWS